MNSKKIVCPYNPALLDRLSGRVVVVRVDDPTQVASAAADVTKSHNELFCVILELKVPVDQIALQDEWKGIPIALMAPSLGKFRNLVKELELLRKLNLRVYLPCSNLENLSGLRILASVGVPCCVTFDRGETNWEALTDLMTYAVLERAPHAPIEPFVFIASHYDPCAYTEWSSIYFDDPKQFLHLDSKGRVALSHAELLKEKFIAKDISEIEDTAACPTYVEKFDAWRQFFLNNHPCACCEGWRVCLGKFAPNGRGKKSKGCTAFFSEMMEVSQRYKALQLQSKEHQYGDRNF